MGKNRAASDESESTKLRNQMEDNVPIYLRKRYLVMFLAFLGFINLYTMRVNLSVAIVAMTKNQTVQHEDGTESWNRPFDWSNVERGYALGAFFYGYITTMLVGGTLAAKFGGTLIFGGGIFLLSIVTLLTPIMSSKGIYYLIAARVLVGAFSGLSYPSVQAVYAKWSPPLERTRTSGFGIAGIYLGTVLAMVLSGWLGENFSWQSIFYVFGGVGCVWSALWLAVVRESPDRDSWIRQDERNYIKQSLEQQGQVNVLKPPWKKLLSSPAVIAICVASFSYTWGFYTLLTQLPSYMNNMLDFNLQNTGFLSAVPYLVLFLTLIFTSSLADWLQMKRILTTTQVRIIFTCSSFLCQLVFLLMTAFFTDTTTVIVCLTLSVGLGAFSMNGYIVNPLDIAPQFASIITGLANTFGTVPGIVSPIITGYIVQTPTFSEYRIVFYISCGVYLFGTIVYGLLASGTVQPWAVVSVEESKEDSISEK
ncbi:hypothetical protein HA402_003997 [Bradysia odoriphaga]|nr:hypothetical protein HA402_003997 [Bradysia odoriphaga]